MVNITPEITDFLKHSNAIEQVFDDISLADAENAFSFITSFKQIDVRNLLHCHEVLMYNQPIEEEYKGKFRNCPVWIGNWECAHYSLIPWWMDDFIERINKGDDWRETHVFFEKCHPFVDGNGRVGRILMNWHRLRLGLPILDINTVEEVSDYYSWFS